MAKIKKDTNFTNIEEGKDLEKISNIDDWFKANNQLNQVKNSERLKNQKYKKDIDVLKELGFGESTVSLDSNFYHKQLSELDRLGALEGKYLQEGRVYEK